MLLGLVFQSKFVVKVDLQNEVDSKTKKVVAKSVIVVIGGALVATPLGILL